MKTLVQELGQSLVKAVGRARTPFKGVVPGSAITLSGVWAKARSLTFSEPGIVIGTIGALNLLRLASSLILTRILAPADFGILGIIGVAHYTVIMLFDLGIDIFIIRHPDIRDKKVLNVVWTLRFIRLCVAAVIIASLAGVVARFYANESLKPALIVSALGLIAAGPQSLSITLATRDKRLILVSLIDVLLGTFNFVVTIVLAVEFRSYWALVIGSIVGTAGRSVLSYVLFPEPFYRFSYDREVVREVWDFSRYAVGSSAITLLLSQLDKLVLGRILPIEEFGIYAIAASLAFVPQTFCAMYGSRVLFPTYSAAFRKNSNSLRRVFHEKLRLVGPLYCFGVGGLLGFAPALISIMYQARYAQAALYFQILLIPAFFALSCLAATEALVALGQVRATYRANLVRLAWLVPATGLAAYSGKALAIVIAIALTEIPATIYTWWKLRAADVLSIRRELPAFVIGSLGVIVGWVMHQVVESFFHISAVGILG